MTKYSHKTIKDNRGLSLLFAVFVSSLILAVGASIISVSLRQMKLSGSARDSQFAFYAANTGIECATYWDFVQPPVFATSTDVVTPASDPTCLGENIIDSTDNADCDFTRSNNTWCVTKTANSATSTFRIKFESPYEYCADVSVGKTKIDEGKYKTIIQSRGYNTCDNTDPRRIERGLRVSY